ncbi:hypothetical protein A2Z22_01520 [Candidatus Woesebacteria bacterium RBG_16_34_12]|uniref:Uncharacterized protein n=1 Tax=Candidatus Woesebacteria bacterium RBG_16_34_12 TaxID=1802480 RepID=A0A1F7XA42_9BACT|nr:MAG: hypothetical protein A2Z22_01520 [Candidatus Woesebacteria bacterium RBG_16_34_12]
MPPVSKRLVPSEIEKRIYEIYIKSFGKVSKRQDVIPFLTDLFTPTERIMIAKRLAIAFLLIRGDYNQRGIARSLKVSTNTVVRINNVLKTQGDGYRKVIDKLLRDEEFKVLLNDLYEIVIPCPPKGANWCEWKKTRRERKDRLRSFS